MFDPTRGIPAETPAGNGGDEGNDIITDSGSPSSSPLKPQRDFTLQGTQITGAARTAILQTPDKQRLVLMLKENGPTPIPGYPDYRLLQVEQRTVHIAYPADAPCRQHQMAKGVVCEAADTARLRLVKTGGVVSATAVAPR